MTARALATIVIRANNVQNAGMKVPRAILLPLALTLVACAAPTTRAAPDLTFIHLNDTYRVDAVEEGRRGGFARVATVVRGLIEDGHDVRLIHGGDFLYPSLESQLWDGRQMVEAMNFLDALAPFYVVPGNHEFDPDEPDALIDALKHSTFDWLGDNVAFVTGDAEADGLLQSAFTFTAGDRTVGVFALTLHEADGGKERDYVPIDRDYLGHAKRVITQLEDEGADLIVGLTHLHLADDIEIAKLKQRHPTFMFIAGGHEHEPEFERGDASSAMVVKGASNARTIWQIDVTFDNGLPTVRAMKIEIDETIAGDPAYRPIEKKWRTRLLGKMPFLPSKIGEAAVRLDAREVTVRNEESNWGNFIADQMLTAFRGKPAELAFINSGTLRLDDYIEDDITFEDVGRTFGFSSYLQHMTLSGRDFRELLEAGYRGSGPSKGYFPQIAGFRVCVDRQRPEGSRIVQMQVPREDGWREIEAGRDYSVVAPEYIVGGGDGYDFSRARSVSRAGSELIYLVLDGILNAQAKGEAIGKPVDPANARIAFLQPGDESCF